MPSDQLQEPPLAKEEAIIIDWNSDVIVAGMMLKCLYSHSKKSEDYLSPEELFKELRPNNTIEGIFKGTLTIDRVINIGEHLSKVFIARHSKYDDVLTGYSWHPHYS